MRHSHLDGLSVVALLLLFFMGYQILGSKSQPAVALQAEPIIINPEPGEDKSSDVDPTAFSAPYEDYILTQGLHGFSYGHMAIDLASGKNIPILSPIFGVVTALFTDQYGNPTLVIENEVYQVTLLHGNYSVSVGEVVSLGYTIGYESNQGYTTDYAGNPCYGRDGCGFHTHLNVFDKRISSNVNPLDLINR